MCALCCVEVLRTRLFVRDWWSYVRIFIERVLDGDTY